MKKRDHVLALGLLFGLSAFLDGRLCAQKAETQREKEPEVISLLGRSLYAAPAEGEELAKLEAALQEAQRAVELSPADPETIIQYGRALAGLWRYHEAIEVFSKGIEAHPGTAMLYRHRGHRFISVRQFDRAAADLARAAELNDRDFDIWYHLGLAHYLRGGFDKARAAYESCLGAAADDDSKIAISNWLYATLRRLNRAEEAAKVLEGISEGMKVEENTSYYYLLLFFKGKKTEEELKTWAENSALDAATVGYGLGCWHLYNGRRAEAEKAFEKVLTNRYWPAFGYIAAEAELFRLSGKS